VLTQPAASPPPPAPAPRQSPPGSRVPSTAELTGKWDELVDRFRTDGKLNLATALAHSSVAGVSASGAVTIELDEPNDFYAHSIGSSRADVVSALRQWFSGIEKLDLRRDEQAPAAPPKRVTDEMVRAERVASLRKRDPVLSAAIEALDLDVAD
jgi:hypothetical protein